MNTALCLLLMIGSAAPPGGAFFAEPTARGSEVHEAQTDKTVFLDIATLTQQAHAPSKGWYVRGQLRDGLFLLNSDLLGSGALDGDGLPGWIELSRKPRFVADTTASAPQKPYIEAIRRKDGSYVLRSAELHR